MTVLTILGACLLVIVIAFLIHAIYKYGPDGPA